MKKKAYIILIFVLLACRLSPAWGQNQQQVFDVTITYRNESRKINNGSAELNVKGGQAPYTYHWTDRNTDTISRKAEGLIEGRSYQVHITDANGQSQTIDVLIPADYPAEKINSTFVPVAQALEKVLLADIFALLDIYDPVLYDDQGNVLRYPNGEPKKNSIPFVVVWLILGALFFTLRMGFVNIWGFKHAVDLVRGRYDKPEDKGEVSHFQALATALSATVGLGNIAGVAIAITLGGPGATFWMIIAGFLGMSSKFIECTLGVKYREIDAHGNVSGGPMYYLKKALAKRNMKGLGLILSGIFAVLVIGGSIGGGNMFQANQAFSQLSSVLPPASEYSGTLSFLLRIGHSGFWVGFILAALVGLVVIGGIKSIAKVTEKIVPFMAFLYVGTALIIIAMNISETGHAFELIFKGAFNAEAIEGGIVGVLITGFRRAAFSNEAGVGSASIAHSAAKTDEPISEGIVALLEPLIDTIVICTMTALVIIFTGYHTTDTGLTGSELTSLAFSSVFPFFKYLLVIAIFLFGFSTMISWSYYGLKGFQFLFDKALRHRMLTPKLPLSAFLYFLIFLSFVVIGASSELGAVVDFSDYMILSMALPNILGLILLSSEIKTDLKDYFKRIRTGEIKRYK